MKQTRGEFIGEREREKEAKQQLKKHFLGSLTPVERMYFQDPPYSRVFIQDSFAI